ncbi:MAG TPA: ribose 5-phosphate isomerase B [Desulfobacteraceae bacterium]|nr:ribose 5-phosphate isomerase B [Desulfobacteraceae bacterium]
MDIIIGSDHAGYDMKEECRLFLEKERGLQVRDAGVYDRKSSDYPAIAKKVALSIASGESERGVLICGSGIGMSIVANRYRGVRAALCHNVYLARLCRQHNDANILVMGGRVIGVGIALEMLTVFLETPFDGGRHEKRLGLIDV